MLFLEMKLQNSLIVKQSDNKLTADINLSYAIGNKKLDQLENIIATLYLLIYIYIFIYFILELIL